MKTRNLVPSLALAFIIAGALVAAVIGGHAANRLWMFGLVLTGAPVVSGTLRSFDRMVS
jgi:hypothetical protein